MRAGCVPDRGLVGTEVTLTGEFGEHPVPVVFSSGNDGAQVTARSWSPTEVVVSVPELAWGTWTVSLLGGCTALPSPSFRTIPPSRVYINNNANNADVVGAALDDAGAPSARPGSPWNFAPDVTNISCMTTARGPTTTSLRLIASDAGNRRIAVFDLPADAAKPIPVPGSPFQLTDTPSELASGIVVLQPPSS